MPTILPIHGLIVHPSIHLSTHPLGIHPLFKYLSMSQTVYEILNIHWCSVFQGVLPASVRLFKLQRRRFHLYWEGPQPCRAWGHWWPMSLIEKADGTSLIISHSHAFCPLPLLPITSRISPSWLRPRKSPPSGLCMGFPSGSVLKNLPASAGDLGSTPGSGRSLGEGNGYPLQYSSLENSMDRGAWWATAHGVAKSQTQLSH